MKRRGYDEELRDIPSMSMSQEDVADYHRHQSDGSVRQGHVVELAPTRTGLLWLVISLMAVLLLVGGYFIADLRYQLSASQKQLQNTTTQIDTLASTDKKVSSTGSALQDQLKLVKSDIQKLKDQIDKLQQDNKSALDQQAQTAAAIDKKIAEINTQLNENKTALLSAQEGFKKNQPSAGDVTQQSAQIKALESKVNELSLDVMAKQEQMGGAAPMDTQKITQIDEQLKTMQNDINKLFIDVDSLK